MEKKPYTPPTVTNLGSIVIETKGFGGETWEYNSRHPWITPFEN
jgi:hypothetical protein